MYPADRLSDEHRDLLLELSLLLSERRGVDEIFAAFSRKVGAGATVDFTSLFVTTADSRFLRSVGAYPEGVGTAPPNSVHRASVLGSDRLLPLKEGMEYIPRKLDLPSTRILAESGYQRAWVTPLVFEDISYGMLTVAKLAHGAFPADHLAFLRAAAGLLGAAVRQDLELDRARMTAARAQAASDLIMALQAGEPLDRIFERLPGLLEDCLDIDYVGLVMDPGDGFRVVAETPAGTHLGVPPTPEGNARIFELAKDRDFVQFRPSQAVDMSDRLAAAGYERGAISFLREGENARGLLLLARRQPRRFDTDEQTFIELLRSILSESLANQRRLSRTEAAAARARTLNEVALLLNAGEGIDAIFQALLDLLDQALDVDYIGLLTSSDDPRYLRMVGSRPELMRPQGTLVPAEEAALPELGALERDILQYRLATLVERTPFNTLMYEAGMRRAIMAVIRVGGEVEGVLSLARRNELRFSPEEEAFLETLSAMLGQAMTNRRRLERAETEAARNKLLNDLAILLNNGERPEAFFQRLSAQMKRVVPFDGMVLLVNGMEEGSLRIVESVRRRAFSPERQIPVSDFGESILARMAAGEIIIEGPTDELGGHVAQAAANENIKQGMIAVVRHEGEAVGYFFLGREEQIAFSPQECSFIEIVCTLVGQAIANRAKVEDKEAEAIRSQVLSELAVLLQGGTRIHDHFETVSEILLQAVGFDFISVTTRRPGTTEWESVRSHELLLDGEPINFNPEGIALIRKAGNTINQYATASADRSVPRAMSQAGFKRAVSAIVTSPAGEEGLFTIGRRDDIRYSKEDLAFVELVAALIGQASANYQKRIADESEALRSRVLSELALLVNNGQSVETQFERLRVLLLAGVGFDYCSICVKNTASEGYRILRSQEILDRNGQPLSVDASTIEAIDKATSFSYQYGPEATERGVPAELFEAGFARAASFALTAGTGIEGLFTVARRTSAAFPPAEMAFFELVATLLGHAVSNERRIATTTAEAEEQAIIADAAAAVARETTALAIIRSLRAAVSRFIPAPFMSFGYAATDGLEFPNRDGGTLTLPLGQNFQDAFDTGQKTVVASRIGTGTPESAAEVKRIGIRAHVITVAKSGGVPTGVLLLGSREPSWKPSSREERLCRLIADIVGPALANARASEQERQHAEDQAIVAEAAAAVAREHSVEGIAASLSEAVSRFVPDAFVRFGYYEDEVVVYRSKTGRRDVQAMGPYYRKALADGQAIVPNLALREAAGERLTRSRQARIQSHVLSRADSAGTVIGFLLIGSRDAQFAPGPREARVCRLIAEIVGPAMANARAAERERAEAEDQAIIGEAAAAVARESTPLEIVRSLRAAVSRFIPRPFVNFGYLENGSVRFPSRTGALEVMPIDVHFGDAIANGQATVPSTTSRVAAGETLTAMVELGIEAHVLTRASGAGVTTGLLVVGSRDATFEPGDREIKLCRLIADIVGPAMANARAAERERQEADEQRMIADVAAAAAREAEPGALVMALQQPLHAIVPLPVVAFGYREDDEVIYPRPDGSMPRYPVDAYSLMAEELGQVHGPELPDDLPSVDLQQFRIHAISATAVRSAGAMVGLLLIGSRLEGYEFGERELRLFRLIAQIVGPAMENARAAQRALADAEEQRILAEAAAAAARATTDQELIRGLWGPVGRFVPESRTTFLYREGENARIAGTNLVFPLGPQVARALEQGQVLGEFDEDEILPDSRHYLWLSGMQRWINTAATSGGEALGVLFVATQSKDVRFTERDQRLCRLIADIIGPALANIRESARRREDAEEQRMLAEAASAVAAGASAQAIIDSLLAPVRRFVPRARISFSYIEGDDLVLLDGTGRRPMHEFARETVRVGQGHGFIDRPDITPASRDLIASVGVREWIDTCAASAGTPVGMLFVGTANPDFNFGEREKRLLRLIAAVAGPAMANAREDERRQAEAIDDRAVAAVAAVAASASSPTEIFEALPAALSAHVPGALVMYGHLDAEHVTYQVTDVRFKELLGSDQLKLSLTSVGNETKETGQSVGTLAETPADRSWAPLKLQAYALTAYFSAGVANGILMVTTPDPAYSFDPRTLAILRRIAQVVGPAVETARAQAEQARQAELYSLILRSLSEGVILADRGGKPVFANELGKRILAAMDQGRQETIWENIVALIPESARDGYRQLYSEGKSSRGRASLDIEGKLTWFDYELVPLNDPRMRALVVASDVTVDVEREADQERHREQMEQSQRLAALGELIGGVAHELNNPLTAILGFAEVMALSEASAPLSEELAIIQKEAVRARNIVRDLLFIARPGTSERSIIPMEELVAHIERLRRVGWQQQGIQCEIRIEPGCTVWGNEHQLTQVLLNLVTNAEYALTDQPLRRMRIYGRCEAGKAILEVTDSGAGMDEVTRSRVFEPFFTTKQGHGTGLGLPLSYSIVQSHQGEIRVDSEPGKGTSITVILPSSQALDSGSEALVPRETGAVARVLVVDDEPSLRKVCQRLIESMGHICDTAENSEQAAKLAKKNNYDLILCDYRLASETADDVLDALTAIAPGILPKVVLATGATTDVGVVTLTEKYGLALMAKPYGIDELAAAIQRAMQVAEAA